MATKYILAVSAALLLCSAKGTYMDATVKNAGGFDIIGIAVRTSNQEEMSGHSKIGPMWQRFFAEGIAGRIPNKADGETVVVYYDYKSDKDGPYSYMIGSRVKSTADIPDGMSLIHVPAGRYAVFTTDRGPVAQVVQKGWKEIWDIPKTKPGGDRAYKVDYEVYDNRARNPQDSQVDIYIGIK